MSTPTELRMKLRDAGFDPIPTRGKNPGLVKDWAWQKLISAPDENIAMWRKSFPDAINTGVLTRSTPALDIDILHQEGAEAIEALVQERFEERGYILTRIGKPPKRAILFRTGELFPKYKVELTAPDGSSGQKIELLADGQQVVVAGIHPETERPYSWSGGEPWAIAHDELPYITREEAHKLVDDAADLLEREFGFKRTVGSNGNGKVAAEQGERHAGDEPHADAELLERALNVIPNNLGWDEWNNVGMAIWRATNGSSSGFPIFDAWSRKSEKYDAKNTATKWAAYFRSPPNSIGAGSIFFMANEAKPGWRTDSPKEIPERDAPPIIPDQGQEAAEPIPDPEIPWPVLNSAALHGLVGDIVRTIEPHTESDPVAILLQTLTYFGNVIGKGPYYQVEGDRHHTNLFMVLVGESSKARKGTSAGRVTQVIEVADREWVQLRRLSGLSSGEGLIWAVRDPIYKTAKDGSEECSDLGVNDKRLLADEREFAQALTVMQREGNTLSRVMRDCWDGVQVIASLTKNSPGKATGAHISVTGHITEIELRRLLDRTSMSNGWANRFLFCCVKRSKCLPQGGNLNPGDIQSLGMRLAKAIEYARHVSRVTMNPAASSDWEHVYGDLSEGLPGLLGAICGRAEAQVIRLATIYALLDGKAVIAPEHIAAGIAVWEYAEASARHIFGDTLGDPLADELLRVIRNAYGQTIKISVGRA